VALNEMQEGWTINDVCTHIYTKRQHDQYTSTLP
jgi:hypothetical protein